MIQKRSKSSCLGERAKLISMITLLQEKWDLRHNITILESVHRMLGVLLLFLLLRQEFTTWICGFEDLWICGFVDLWICGFEDLRICGFLDLWICGAWKKNSEKKFPNKICPKILEKLGPKGPTVCSQRLQASAGARKKPPTGRQFF